MKNAAYPTLFSLVFMLNQAFCPPSVAAADFVIVESGTVVTAIVLENLSTVDGSVQKGNAVKMVVGQDVIVAGQKVVTKGSPAEGIVLNVKREKDVKNYPDRLLRLEVVLKWVRAVDGQIIHVNGSPHLAKSPLPRTAAEVTTLINLQGFVESTIRVRVH